jgi:hypothetical protein
VTDKDSVAASELHKAFQQVAPDLGFHYDPWEQMPDLERRLAVRAVWQATQSRHFLAGVLAEVKELEVVERALVREKTIRSVAKETGEPYEIVAEQVDALDSMDQEAVLDLTEGEPTTLRDGLERWLSTVQGEGYALSLDRLVDELSALLGFPWPEGDGAHPDVITVRKADGSAYGIRPHLPRTPEQDAQERMTAEQWLADNPVTPEQVARIMDGTE